MFYISIGHSGGDVGAVANGAIEFNVCEKIGNKVVEILNAKKLPSKVVDPSLKLSPRIQLINKIATAEDVLIELHMDSASPSARGATVFYYTGDTKSQKMADLLADKYCSVTGIKKRASLGDTQNRHGRLAIVRDTKPRAFLIELGFISNVEDLKIVQEKAVDALVLAILEMLGIAPIIEEDKVAPWAEEAFKKAEKKGFSKNDLNAPIDPVRLRKCLVKANVDIKDSNNPVTYQEFVVILDRLNLLNQ